MTQRKSIKRNIVHSVREWKNKFLGETAENDTLNVVKNDPIKLGEDLANRNINSVLQSRV